MKHIQKFENYNNKINEGFGTVLLGIFVAFRFLKWVAKLSLNKMYRSIVLELLKSIKITSIAKTRGKEGSWEDAMQVAEFNDRYYITMNGAFASIKNFRILKKEMMLIVDLGGKDTTKVQLTETEYSEFLNIIKTKQ